MREDPGLSHLQDSSTPALPLLHRATVQEGESEGEREGAGEALAPGLGSDAKTQPRPPFIR